MRSHIFVKSANNIKHEKNEISYMFWYSMPPSVSLRNLYMLAATCEVIQKSPVFDELRPGQVHQRVVCCTEKEKALTTLTFE